MTVNGNQIDHQRPIDINLENNSRTVEAYNTLIKVLKDQGVVTYGLMFDKKRVNNGLFFFASSNHKDRHQHIKTVELHNKDQYGLGIDWKPLGHNNRLVWLLISSFNCNTQITYTRQVFKVFICNG